METFRKIAIVALIIVLASCNKASIVGTWVSVSEVETGEWEGMNTTITETFYEDGTYKGSISMPLGSAGIGANGDTRGSYELIEDSLILYYDKFVVMGKEVPIKDDGRSVRKIIKLDKNTFIYSAKGKKHEMKRISDKDKK